MKIRFVLFIIALVLWLLLNWSLDYQHFIVGGLAAFLVAFVTADLFFERRHLRGYLRRAFSFLFEYIPLFICECIKANLDFALKVLHPDLPVNPGIIKIKTSLKSNAGLAFLANSITLRPGTLTVDIDKENGLLYVHWLNVATRDPDVAAKIITDKFEPILAKIFE